LIIAFLLLGGLSHKNARINLINCHMNRFNWARGTKAGRWSSILVWVVSQTWPLYLQFGQSCARCYWVRPRVHARSCHWLISNAAFTAKYGASKRSWTPLTTRCIPEGRVQSEYIETEPVYW